MVLAVALVVTIRGVASKDSLLGIHLPSGERYLINGGTKLLDGRGPTEGPAVSVGLCGRSSCCVLRINGFYNGHAGKADAILVDHNNLLSNGSSRLVQKDPDPRKLPLWLVEGSDNDYMVMYVANNNQAMTVTLADTPCQKKYRDLTVQCRPDETQLFVQSTGVGYALINLGAGRKEWLWGPTLSAGDQVTLTMRVASSRYTSSLYVGLCWWYECATVVIATPASAGTGNLAFGSGFTVSNNPNDDFSVTYQDLPREEVWAEGEYDFTVAFHPAGLLQVWLRPDTVAQVPMLPWKGYSLELKALHPYGTFSYSRQQKNSLRAFPAARFAAPIRVSSKHHLRTNFSTPAAIQPPFCCLN